LNLKGFTIEPSHYSETVDLHYKNPVCTEVLRGTIIDALAEVTKTLQQTGCTLIGHIKALLDAGSDGQLFFSITSFDEEARSKGEIKNTITEAKYVINVIVFGSDEVLINKIVKKSFSKLMQ